MSKRRYFIFFPIILFFGLLSIGRLINLNILNKIHYQTLLDYKTNKIVEGNSAPRGRIIDRNGNILVDNIGIKTIVYTKISGISTEDEINISKKLAEILTIVDNPTILEEKKFWILINPKEAENLITKKEYQNLKERKITTKEIEDLKYKRITEEDLNTFSDIERKASLIYSLMNKGYLYEKKVIKSIDVSEEEYATVIESEIPGVTGELNWERTYPYGNTLRTILGNISTEKSGLPKDLEEYYLIKGYTLNDRVGVSYLELQYEEYLRGTKAKYLINSNNSLSIYEEGKRGNDLVLSIDIDLQLKIEEIVENHIINAKKETNTEYFDHSYVIISNPNTGNILAMTGKQIINSNLNQTFKNIDTNIISSSYTMGSVIKGASMTVGYQNNLITPGQKILDSCVKLYNIPEKCSFKSLGYIDDISALSWSSNYYQFLLAIGITGNKYSRGMRINANEEDFNLYRNTFASYGLGIKTGIDLPNEKIGTIGKTVAIDLLLNIAIGQYDTYTPIELVQYINTIANKGNRIAPSLMLGIINNDGKIIKKNDSVVLDKVDINPTHLNRIIEGFKAVVHSGTATGFTNTKYKPAGKTGTSESFFDSNNDGKSDIQTISANYVMFAPYDNPKYSLVTVSPNLSHNNGNSEYMSWVHKRISKQVSDFLFENY